MPAPLVEGVVMLYVPPADIDRIARCRYVIAFLQGGKGLGHGAGRGIAAGRGYIIRRGVNRGQCKKKQRPKNPIETVKPDFASRKAQYVFHRIPPVKRFSI